MCFIVKYVLFFANVVFTLAGLALIGVGVAVLIQASAVVDLIPINFEAIPISTIVVGVIIFIIAFFGCCGAIRENRCFLTIYGIIMLLLAAGKMYLAVVIFMAMDTIRKDVVAWLTDAFRVENLKSFHPVEIAFQCCGTTGAASYVGILPALPPSCCSADVTVCEANNAFAGCNDIVGDFFETYGEATASVIVVVVGVELIAMLFAFCLCGNIGRRKRQTV